jgi:hypothetical protein
MNSRQLPSNIILRAQALPALLEGSEITRRHHSRAGHWGAGDGEGSREFLLGSADNVVVLVVLVEGVGVG